MGQMFSGLVNKHLGGPNGLFDMAARDENGNVQTGAKNPYVNVDENGNATTTVKGALHSLGVNAFASFTKGLGDVIGQGFATNAAGTQASQAMNTAGIMADAANNRAQQGVVEGANQANRDLNTNIQGAALGMADSAIAQANSFESGMQGIGMSGISGSKNMERNLQYGQDRAEAENDLQFALMGNQAQDIEDSMVGSFDQLSQNKADAMVGAYNNSMGQSVADLFNQRQETSQAAFNTQNGPNDEEAAILGQEGKQDPTEITETKDPIATEQYDGTQQSNAQPSTYQGGMGNSRPREGTGTAQTPQAGQAAQQNNADHYDELEQFLKAGVSEKALGDKMKALGIDEATQQAIQQGVMRGDKNWRTNLKQSLGGR
jgi:hypothetical protein